MEVRFSRKRIAKLCSTSRGMVKEWGADCAKRLQQRLAELEAAETLDDMRALPGARCHESTGHRRGQLAVDLTHPYRLVFEPDHEPRPEKPDGGLDWRQVTRIVVIQVVDYH